jgi:hypothetical protein
MFGNKAVRFSAVFNAFKVNRFIVKNILYHFAHTYLPTTPTNKIYLEAT